MMIRSLVVQIAAPLFALATFGACTSSTDTSSASPLTEALSNATTASGALACAPTAAQVAACDGKAADAACTLDVDATSRAGTCRDSISGELGCAPTPPAPPAEAVAACDGKAQGDACVRADDNPKSDDEAHAGICATARDGVSLACTHAFTPPASAVTACDGKITGDACTMVGHEDRPGHDDHPMTGTCSNGPSGTATTLACRPASRFPDAASACAGLAAGTACSFASGHEHASGTCTADPSGDVLCVLSCGGHEGGDDHGRDGADDGSDDHGQHHGSD